MQPAYRPPRDRDAYATIRGFVYQVDRTVERWLNLGAGFCLELERGEDIDVDCIDGALAQEDPEVQRRLLEQIKHRDRSLTLREPSALESLANAVEHLGANAGLELRFCYLTNATIGCENLSPFPNHTPGITLWEQVRLQTLPPAESAEAITSLRNFLQNQGRPVGVRVDVWTSFQVFLSAGDANFQDLISRFEWSTGRTPAADYAPCLQEELCRRGFAADSVESRSLYERLFLWVLRLLCRPGLKRLTRAELDTQRTAPALAAPERAFLALLQHHLEQTNRRVAAVEQAVGVIAQDIQVLAGRMGVPDSFTMSAPVIDLALPPLAARLSRRGETSERLLRLLTEFTWIALSGGPDTGKSQLALLAATRHGQTRGWVRFNHSLQLDAACTHLDDALVRLSGEGGFGPSADGYRSACRRIGTNGLLVLDDLPRLAGDEPLSQRLALLARACVEAGCKLVSTSQHLLPSRLRNELSNVPFSEIPVPPFSDSEARDIFLAHGAPAGLLDATVRFVNGLARGHPLLLALAAEYLSAHGWELREEEFDALLRGDHAERAQTEALARLAERLGEPQRELLFRLSLILGTFTSREVTTLARVAPEVVQSQVRLSELLGAWVQWESTSRMLVSPLVVGLGSANLALETRRDCHRALADLHTQGRMNQNQARDAIYHNMAAEEYDRALTLFVVLLEAMRRQPAGAEVGSVLGMWASTPLPEQAGVGMRLWVRGYQLAVLLSQRRSVSFLLQDIDRLLAEATDADGWGITTVAVFAARHLGRRNPLRALRYLSRALELDSVRHADGSEMAFPSGVSLDELLWTIVPSLNSPRRLAAWRRTIGRLPPRRRRQLFRTPLGRQGVLVLSDALFQAEMAKPQDERNWEPVIQAAEDLEAWGTRHGLTRVRVAALRSLTIIHGDPLRQIDRVAPRVLAALEEFREVPRAVFLLAGTLGRHYTLCGRHADALPLLELALRQTVRGHHYDRMLFLLAASHSRGEVDALLGLTLANAAAAIAETNRRIDSKEAARALAERGLARFLTVGGQPGARLVYAEWAQTAERVLQIADGSELWRDLVVIFAHATSYFSSLAATGNPPTEARDGGAFLPPGRGCFMVVTAGRSDLYFPGFEVGLLWILARYAEATGNQADALQWLSRAVAASEEVPGSFLQATMGLEFVPILISADRYEEAFQAGVLGCRAMVVMRANRARSFESLVQPGQDIAAMVRALDPAQALLGEQFAVIAALVPILVRIVHRAGNTDRSAALTDGRNLASLCRQSSTASRASELWVSAANILEAACRDDSTAEQLVAMGNAVGVATNPELMVLAYLGSTIHAAPLGVFCAQVACMGKLFEWHPADSATSRMILLPYIESSWQRIGEQSSFHFSAPTLVAEALPLALQEPVPQRIKAILRAVRMGFVRLPSGLGPALSWLSGSDVLETDHR